MVDREKEKDIVEIWHEPAGRSFLPDRRLPIRQKKETLCALGASSEASGELKRLWPLVNREGPTPFASKTT